MARKSWWRQPRRPLTHNMKTYAQYEQESFIETVDAANAKMNQLETKRGLRPSPFESNLTTANRRIHELENGAVTQPAKSTAPVVAKTQDLSALKARHLWLLNLLGLTAAYQTRCSTAAEYTAEIARLEARLSKSVAALPPEAPKKPEPFTPQTAAVAYFTGGKATGLAKAIGAATQARLGKK